jgi:hypothetical protein
VHTSKDAFQACGPAKKSVRSVEERANTASPASKVARPKAAKANLTAGTNSGDGRHRRPARRGGGRATVATVALAANKLGVKIGDLVEIEGRGRAASDHG